MMMTTAITALMISLSPIAGHIADAPQSPAHRVEEDDPGWSCVSDGNRICGPANSEGKPAGCYDDGGVMVAAWPCYVVVNGKGDADVYTPDAR